MSAGDIAALALLALAALLAITAATIHAGARQAARILDELDATR